jgi:hypothetical protein
MPNDAIEKSRLASAAATIAPTAESALRLGFRIVTAGALSFVPGVGAAVQELVAAEREREATRSFDLFVERVEVLERQVGRIANVPEYLASPSGREHVLRIFENVFRAEGEKHREALSNAYVSGAGLGRFQPDTVLLLDATLARLSQYHVQVLQWCHAKQAGRELQGRLRDRIRIRDLVRETSVPGAVVQKVIGDLVDTRVLMDTGINKLGGYWGTLSVALTSFGMTLALYLESPTAFIGNDPPCLESPFPPERISADSSPSEED